MNKGIAIAGNMLVDKIKMIDVYPCCGMLCNIKSQKTAVGGCVPNTAIDIAKIDNTVSLFALGKIGKDESGDYIISMLKENGVDTSKVIRMENNDTSYSDVMTVIENGHRTFYHYRGNNADFGVDDINFDDLNCDILHIGYALLLDKFDQKNAIYGTELARALYLAKQKGILTSIDVVSEESTRFKEIVSCSIKYCDYITLNEIESSNVSEIPLRDKKGSIIEGNLKKVCEWFIKQGVNKQVCIHFPEGCCAMTTEGQYRQLPSLKLPKNYIKGTVGAGDAFCAGILYSAFKQFNLKDSLLFAVKAAAQNLSCEDSISGMKSYNEIITAFKDFGFRDEIAII